MGGLLKRPLFWCVALGALAALVFILRLTGLNDLEADAQNRNIGYIMDAVVQGNWSAQHEVRGPIMSKPPLHTWVAGAFASLGGINRLTLSLPSGLAVLGLTLLVFQAGRQRFGLAAGVLAGLAVVLAPMTARHITLVRTDALFALTVALGAVAAYRAWERGDGWLYFWLAGAAATLTKGPLGPVLAASGLLASIWERRTDPATPRLRGSHVAGIGLFLGLTLGWFLLALHAHGYDLVEKLFIHELFGQAVGTRKGLTPGENLYKPTLFMTIRFLPFSLFAFYGAWRVLRQPSAEASARRFERFLFCWFAAGLLMFSLGAHFRADLLLPLWPAGALLAGREMAGLGNRIGWRAMSAATAALVIAIVGAVYWTYHVKARKNKEVRYSVVTAEAARALAASGLDVQAIHHLDTPVTLQLGLGTYKELIDQEEALRLARGSEPALLAVETPEDYPQLFGPGGPPLQEVFRWPPGNMGGKVALRVFRNAAK